MASNIVKIKHQKKKYSRINPLSTKFMFCRMRNYSVTQSFFLRAVHYFITYFVILASIIFHQIRAKANIF